MIKLYKNLRPVDWMLIALLCGLTVVQVYFTMTLVDYVQNIIQSITYLDYHNHPEKFGEALSALVGAVGWDKIDGQTLSALGVPEERVALLVAVAKATVGDIWKKGGMMLLVALGSEAPQMSVGLIASYVSSSLTTRIRSRIYAKIDEFSVREIDSFSTASLITRTTNDVQQVQIANVMMLRMVIAAPITAVWAILKIRATSLELTVATLAAVIVMIVCIACIMITVLPTFRKMQKLTDRLNSVTRENLTGTRIVRAYYA